MDRQLGGVYDTEIRGTISMIDKDRQAAGRCMKGKNGRRMAKRLSDEEQRKSAWERLSIRSSAKINSGVRCCML